MTPASASLADTTRRLVPALTIGMSVALALALGLYARAPHVPGPTGGTRMLRRVAPAPPDLPTLLYQLGIGSIHWYAAAIGFPLLVWGARRLDTARLGRARSLAIAALAIALLVVATAVAQYIIDYRTDVPLAAFLGEGIRRALLPWIALVGIVAALEWRRRAVRSQLEHERLRAEVAEQRLRALTGQLQPHFLFNTLQGISTLIHRDADAADEMLTKLGDLLRDLLRQRDQMLVPLADELRYARTYLEIAQLRFGGRLTFRIDVPDSLHATAVPLFILQPLLENALTHGIGRRARGGSILVHARRNAGRVELVVEDDGDGMPPGTARRDGIGLSNTRERLRATYGEDHGLEIGASAESGTVARLTLPWLPVTTTDRAAAVGHG